MKKLLLALLLIPAGAMAQLAFDPFVSCGYLKEAPNVKNSRATRDYEGNISHEGAPRLVYLSDISNVKGFGMYFGGGAELGLKNFPLRLRMEVAGEHFGLSYHLNTRERYRTEYDFEVREAQVQSYISYFRFTPSVAYKSTLKSGINLQAQAGVSILSADNHANFMSSGTEVNSYSSVNAGAGIGYRGLTLILQADFGTANMLRHNTGFNLYSQRFTAGINVYPKQLLQLFR